MEQKLIISVIIILGVVLIGCVQVQVEPTPITPTIKQEPVSEIVIARLDSFTGGDFVPSAGYYEGQLELSDTTTNEKHSIFACSKSWDWVKKGHCYRFSPEEVNENIKQRMFSAELSGCYVGSLEEVKC